MAQATGTRITRVTEGTGTGAPSVLAVVVTHNGREWLKHCLVGLAGQTYRPLDVLVVDDGSPDSRRKPALKRVAKRHLRRRRWGYVRTPRPLGFGAAVNWALSRVRTDADLLLFVHDDAVLDPGSVAAMVDRLVVDDDVAIVGPKVVSWDDPQVLEEVGMAVDRFGYPYKGLEEGEIDLGQHDRPAEVFFVTSTCMLVRHGVFRQLRGWDARMRAFSEDLDLCWRARVAGHSVRFEPRARARHAIALATGRRESPFRPTRYYIRRNRLRTVAKNASTWRLLFLVPQFVLLTIAEMLGFMLLRQPREILNLGRALVWNLIRFPQTFAERRRVQRRRKVPDYRLRWLTVKESTRLRAYAGLQAQRIEEAWGRRAEVIAARGTQARRLGDRFMGWPGVLVLGVVLGVLIGFRHILWADPAAVGEMLPYPPQATAMWRTYFSSWNDASLGAPGPMPPAFGLLGFVPILTLGATGAAQKALVLGLGGVAFIGAYGLVSELVDRPARLASGLAYAFGAVGYAGVREGRLGALVLGAAAPFVLSSLLRLGGWARPPLWSRGRTIARVALGGGVSAAFVPGSLVLYVVVAGILALSRAVLDRTGEALRGLLAAVIGLGAAWVLLLPWSATWFAPGGALDLLRSEPTWSGYAASFAGHGMGSTVLGQTPEGAPLFGLALTLLGVIAVLIADGARRRVALALWAVVAVTGWAVDLIASGWMRPFVPSPTEAGVLAAVALAGLAGLAVGGFRLDLARRSLGWMHAVTLGALAFSAFLIAAGISPALWHGDWDPGRTSGGTDPHVVSQVSALLNSESQQFGEFRALWIGSEWSSRFPTGGRPGGDYFVTGPRSPLLTDLFARTRGTAEDALDGVVSSIEQGATDRGGRLIGALNIHFVILESTERAEPWLAQRDLALIREEEDFYVFRNQVELPRAGVYDEIPAYVRALDERDVRLTSGAPESSSADLVGASIGEYRLRGAGGPGVVFLAESSDPGWVATAGGEPLRRMEGEWGNAFALPAGAASPIVVHRDGSAAAMVLGLATVLVWGLAVGAAFPRRRPGPHSGEAARERTI